MQILSWFFFLNSWITVLQFCFAVDGITFHRAHICMLNGCFIGKQLICGLSWNTYMNNFVFAGYIRVATFLFIAVFLHCVNVCGLHFTGLRWHNSWPWWFHGPFWLSAVDGILRSCLSFKLHQVIDWLCYGVLFLCRLGADAVDNCN